MPGSYDSTSSYGSKIPIIIISPLLLNQLHLEGAKTMRAYLSLRSYKEALLS